MKNGLKIASGVLFALTIVFATLYFSAPPCVCDTTTQTEADLLQEEGNIIMANGDLEALEIQADALEKAEDYEQLVADEEAEYEAMSDEEKLEYQEEVRRVDSLVTIMLDSLLFPQKYE